MTTSGDNVSRTVRRMLRYLGYWTPPVLWAAVIYFLSDQPQLPYFVAGPLDTVIKKLAHFIEYAILASLLARAWWWSTGRYPGAATYTASVSYALTDEYHQLFVVGRHGSLFDVGVDALGALCGLVLFVRWRGRHRGGDDYLSK